ncbi:cysteine desulfurase family protein [Halobacillus sp. HZG1]|uniref:cysteine desulfurase family protein n=1 Tax=Halobacillus sp. HZG1 TaxID=3111769 RepID=UPI002DBD31F4|nr:cysteine desulfurase family protein [Halobacillus sp. HZG1]MEC3885011.1 cysteine desulfurase family protein [Halobacillus sp. HZG1]
MIYLDNSATTHPHDEVLESFQKVADQYFANPSSVHRFGSEAERLLDRSRKQAAQLLNVSPQEVVFTSGGTEGNNMAIKGVALQHQTRGKHLITTEIEHPSVMEAFKALETLGFEVTYINVDQNGKVNPEDIKQALRDDTILVSVMSVNNELGTIQPVQKIGELLKPYPKVFFHVDHVQGLGKIELSLNDWGIDLCTLSGHKIHGLKGTGALLMQKHVRIFPLLHGGNQEAEVRAGTENLPGTVAFVKALRLLHENREQKIDHLSGMRKMLWEGLMLRDFCRINSPEDGAPHIVNFSIPGYKPEVIIHALGEEGIFISTKSACSSKQPDVSAVLKACNLDYERTTSALRVSLSTSNRREEIDLFLKKLDQTVENLQATMG